jgi:phage tail sheath protein FI
MPEYLSPGVYIEEITGAQPIEGVSTSTTGFVGVTQKGPLDTLGPVLVTSLPEFERTFGGYFAPGFSGTGYNFLPHAVAGFFNNGGQRLYIKRVAASGAGAPGVAIADKGLENNAVPPPLTLMTRLADTVQSGALSVKLESLLGLENGTTLTLTQVKNGITTASATLTVSSYNSQKNIVWFTPALTSSFEAQYTTVALTGATVVTAQGAPANTPGTALVPVSNVANFKLQAASPGIWGNTPTDPAAVGLRVQITASSRAQAQVQAVSDFGGGTSNLVTLNSAQNLYAGAIVEFDPVGTYAVLGTLTGTFTSGEQVVQGTTNARGNVVRTVPGELIIIGLIGTPDAAAGHLWTGSSSGATLAPSAVPAANGTYTVTRGVPPITGTFVSGEQVVQATTNAAAIVVGTVPAAGPMVITGLTGAPDPTHNWVGQTSGATFPPGAMPSAANPVGKFYGKVQSIQGTKGIQLLNGLTATQLDAVNANSALALPTWARTCEFDIAASCGNVSETFRGLTLDNTTPYFYGTTIINGSSLLSVPQSPSIPSDQSTTDPSTMPVATDGLNVAMAGGTDGSAPVASDFIGTDLGPGNRTGIAALIDAPSISIIGAPGITDQDVQDALIIQCELLKYRFAILDPASSPTGGTPSIQDIQNQRDLYDTKYAAIYYPRLIVTDPLTNMPLTIPPSGHMAGIYAQTDNARGVWKAPANIVVNGIDKLEIKLSKGDQDILNPEPNNICCFRDFRAQGRGLRIYGARCITSLTEWKYINVRRLFIFLEASLDQGTQWAVFEPNDQTLWNRLIQSVSAFLTTIWREGGLMGSKAEEAYFVKCGRDTMSQDDIDNGRLIMLVGVAPVFPAEFVIIRIGQWAGGSSVQEL